MDGHTTKINMPTFSKKSLKGERVFGFNVPQTTCVMIRNVRTDWSGQTVKEQSDQGLYCLPFRLLLMDALRVVGRATMLKC